MTPAERLLAAADLLDKRASEAAQPWEMEDDNHLALLLIAMPYTIGPNKNRPHKRFHMSGPDDVTTRYIATMHPEVGKALLDVMRNEARYSQKGEGAGWDGKDVRPARLVPIPAGGPRVNRCPTCKAVSGQTRRPILVGSEPPPPECPDLWHYPHTHDIPEEIAS